MRLSGEGWGGGAMNLMRCKHICQPIGEGVGSEGKGEDRSDCGAGVEEFPLAR